MGSTQNCEIIEVNDEPTTTYQNFHQVRAQERDKRPPPIQKKGPNMSLMGDDINKLFESINLRTSKSLDLTDSRRNPSKKPMRGSGSYSPGIGFSEPVSLKQALRGMCISQAAEMAAVKRSSMPASPRISEVGIITNLYRSSLVEAGESSRGKECRIEVSLVPEESTSYSSDTLPQSTDSSPCSRFKPIIKSIECISDNNKLPLHLQELNTNSSNQIADSPTQVPVSLVIKNAESSLVHKDIAPVSEVKLSKPEKKTFSSKKIAIGTSEDKARRKSKIQYLSSSSAVKSNKDGKSTRVTSRAFNPVIRNKKLVIKKPKKVAVSNKGPEHNSEELICHKCQCSLSKDDSAAIIVSIQTGEENRGMPVAKTNTTSKSSEKGDISQSSKSSDFSSSTTSLSEESNVSGANYGNRPHMSKDVRWGAIEGIRKQYGFLGLSHFNLLKKLGSGDIGTVYLAELIGTNCTFAIKVMDIEFLAKRKKMTRAQTEREILRMLDHPFLPTLYAQFTSDHLSCLVMEFCPGGDLHVLRQKQPGRYFPEQAARFYVAEVLLALEYLHMLGIVYRDLKPENIMVREDGHIMLTDFDLSLRCSVNPTLVKSSSLAIEPPRVSGPCAGSNCIDPFCTGPSCKMSCFSPRLLHATKARKLKAEALAHARSLPQLVAEPTEARSNSFVGTHEYLAPEIIKGEGHGSAVDWWTFGVFLYELLYGKTPFKGAGNEETLANVVLQSLRFPDSPIVSFQARDLIRGLLVKEPENRLGTETGAAEIKRHSFFEGLNWALIRCAVPPQIPEMYDVGNSGMESLEKGKKYLDYNASGEQVEFELF
ncbi:hypothetical protein RD792_012047 [Penstemon davidsonii]|uniref:non-specific serine/threonine protein kinase n=1 Tax=Penstemon davidsonii TaxID=160366 RepID=A0ABR0CXA0_9LAMI|nr:hypothetical protein RD792_012047 [Penstemon davidsonii]